MISLQKSISGLIMYLLMVTKINWFGVFLVIDFFVLALMVGFILNLKKSVTLIQKLKNGIITQKGCPGEVNKTKTKNVKKVNASRFKGEQHKDFFGT